MGLGAVLPSSLEFYWKEPRAKAHVPKRYICQATQCSLAWGAIIAIGRKAAFRRIALKIFNKR